MEFHSVCICVLYILDIYICKSRMTLPEWWGQLVPTNKMSESLIPVSESWKDPFSKWMNLIQAYPCRQPLHEPLPPRFFSPLKRLFIRKSLHAQPHGNSPAARTGGVTGVVWFSWLSWISGSLDIVMSGLPGMLPAIFHDGWLGPEWNLRKCLGCPP